MNQNSAVYSYGYPYTWGSSSYAQANYPYASSSSIPRNSLTPAVAYTATTQKTASKKKRRDGTGNLTAVIILAALLFLAIIGLITLGLLYAQQGNHGNTSTTTTQSYTTTTERLPTTTPIPPTVIGFNVTKTKLPYEDGLAQQYSALFNMTNAVFCNQINEWLDNKYGTDECRCIKFEPGIIATVHLTIGSSFGTSEKLLTDIRSVIPEKSTAEPDINAIKAEDIVIID